MKAKSIDLLGEGDKFIFSNLSNFRNLVVRRVSQCGTTIYGEWRHGKDQDWKSLGTAFVVSNNSQVIPVT